MVRKLKVQVFLWTFGLYLQVINGLTILKEETLKGLIVIEETPIGTVIANVTTDSTGLSFSLSGGADVFGINNVTGSIFVKSRLDREIIGGKVDVTIEATKTMPCTPETCANVKAWFIISDINDNTPQFSSLHYSVNISEKSTSGLSVLTMSATDMDAEEINQRVNYAIVSGNEDGIFDIDFNKGVIRLARELDFEQMTQYKLNISASNPLTNDTVIPKNGLSNWTMVTVNVLDADDLPVRFNNYSYSASIPENAAMGSVVMQVHAKDLDKSINAPVTYAIDKETNPLRMFNIANITGEITLNGSLDRETIAEYRLRILAYCTIYQDHTEVLITVTDVNDNIPLFTLPSYNTTVNENAAIGTYVIQVQAEDIDQGVNASFIYEIAYASHEFVIGEHSGIIIVNGTLDREKKDFYSITVIARETETSGGFHSNVTITVMLRDENDNSPIFSRALYSSPIYENEPPGTFVIQVSANDSDIGSNAMVSYAVLADAEGHYQYFKINAKNGTITTSRRLDRENITTFRLRVTASDGAPLSTIRVSVVDVVVTVLDINDNSPEFVRPSYNFSVIETALPGALLGIISAVDRDKDLNGNIVYIITEGNVEGSFIIDARSGLLQLNHTLDREVVSKHSLRVTASDRGGEFMADGSSLNTTINVTVNVLDSNDNIPVCNKVYYTISIPENTSVGQSLIHLNCTDQDSGENAHLLYHMVSGHSKFVVDNVTGIMSLNKLLDFEEKPTVFTVAIEVIDHGRPPLSLVVFVNVTVDNVNDNYPSFGQDNYTFWISEGDFAVDHAIVGVVSAHDLDADSSNCPLCGKLQYTLGNSTGPFAIDKDTGVLRAVGSLDREGIKNYTFSVIAQDSIPNRPLVNVTMVTVNLLDVNDNDPVFDRDVYTANVSEDASPGLTVLKIRAVDNDLASNANVSYSIVSGNTGAAFHVDNVTGEIKLVSKLEREKITSYTLTVGSADGGAVPRRSTALVIIYVMDVNDNSPVCLHDTQTVRLLENLPAGHFVVKVVTTDPDEVHNGRVEYNLTSDAFRVDPYTGIITTTRALDRESIPAYNLMVTARNSNSSDMEVNCSVHVIVMDTNDHTPSFTMASYNISTPETTPVGSTLFRVRAVDGDDGINAEVRYTLMGEESLFRINYTTGIVTLVSSLDRENKAQYQLEVEARDRGIPESNANSTTILIRVGDVNDNRPTFTHAHYDGNVLEGQVGAVAAIVVALDKDEGINADIVYSIIGGNTDNSFAVNNKSGSIYTLLPLDRETTDRYILTVLASDRGEPAMNSSTNVTIHVNDVNDNKPNITNNPGVVVTRENTPPGSLVYILSASDLDEGSNARVTFSGYAVPDGKFSIKPNGEIMVRDSLDREAQNRFVFYAMATDSGQPPFNSSMVSFDILIADENDNNPVFDPVHYSVNISENGPSEEVIVQVNASERDEGKLLFKISSGDPGGYFTIHNVTGVISTRKPLDREMVSRFDLTITAEDEGRPSRMALGYVTIFVNDENDFAPVIEQCEQLVSVSENAHIGSAVASINAVDKDDPSNTKITYSVGNSAFNITTQRLPFSSGSRYRGIIITAGLLDRERQDNYNITVTASDGNHIATCNIIVRITDVNDNSPVFNQTTMNISLHENVSGGTKVLEVQAYDPDEGPNARITYSLKGGNGKFFISAQSGNIYTTPENLDRETKDFFNLTVTAMDEGGRTGELTILVFLLDMNDNRPRFTQSVYYVNITETTGHVMAGVSATDQDLGSNAVISYRILGGNIDDVFNIDNATGALTWSNLFDRERPLLKIDNNGKAVYSLLVEAADHGNPTMTSSATVHVLVDDINDNSPIFSETVYSFTVKEDAQLAHTVGKVTAEDKDWGINARLSYSINHAGHSLPFRIDGNTGIIIVNQSLDHETASYYNISVKATDNGVPALSNTTLVVITIIDVNDNAPEFSQLAYPVNVSERTPGGQGILQVTATDADSDENAKIQYSIVSGDEGKFVVQESTGVIRLVGNLDYEAVMSYKINVSARDYGRPRLEAFVAVHVHVTDANDQPPVFTSLVYEANVTENERVGTMVTKVEAKDPDVMINSKMTYSLHGDMGYFSIDGISGEIKTAEKLDREAKEIYRFYVNATDDGDARLSSQAEVVVNVLDVNDNPPVFPSDSIQLAIHEDTAVGSVIGQLQASDKDKEENAKLEYKITQNNTDIFAVEAMSGTLTLVKPAKDAVNQNISFVVTCKDHGRAQHTASLRVSVFVFPVNQNAPKIYPRHMVVSVYENASKGDMVASINATDADSHDQLLYTILAGGDGRFQLNSSTGVLSVVEQLDRESTAQYKLFVLVQDRQSLPYSDYGEVDITVIDVNDNQPQLSKLTALHVAENTPVGTSVGQISATDGDEGVNAEVFYYISGNASSFFRVDNRSGAIYTLKTFDREQESSYNLTIIAENTLARPRLRSKRMYHVVVDDVNDFPPSFSRRTYYAHVTEGTPVGTLVINLNASDPDTDSGKSHLVYRIIHEKSSLESYRFLMDPESGDITTQSEIDRERIASYNLTVEVRDLYWPNRNRSQAVLTVFVDDVNDNAPRFPQINYTFSASESSAIGDVIARVHAEDKDEGSNAVITYQITLGNEDGNFLLHPMTGDLTIAKPLDFEYKSVYTLTVRSFNIDPSSPLARARRQVLTSKSDEAIVTVKVNDANDNQPVFIKDVFVGGFVYKDYTGGAILAVKAIDKDSFASGPVIYRETNQSPSRALLLNPRTGHVSLNLASIHVNEATKRYTLEVMASDNEGKFPYNNSTKTANVVILQFTEDDNVRVIAGVPPEFIMEKKNELERILGNITGGTVIISNITSPASDPRSSVIVMKVVTNGTLSLLNQDDIARIFKEKKGLIDDQYSKWHLSTPKRQGASEGQEVEPSMIAIMVIAVLIGIGGIICICFMCCAKYRRDGKSFEPDGQLTTEFSGSSNGVAW
ncbi:cadherin-23 isoform X2 [Nematostella vectensis]|nr:cadherin-23 isoform X2 [Nematostella vectensis]